MYNFDARHGWNEIDVPASIATQVPVIAALAGHRIVIRRIRGSAAESFILYSGTGTGTKIGPTIAANLNIDIPGLNYRTGVGKSLTIVGGATAVNLAIQYAYVNEPLPRGDQVV